MLLACLSLQGHILRPDRDVCVGDSLYLLIGEMWLHLVVFDLLRAGAIICHISRYLRCEIAAAPILVTIVKLRPHPQGLHRRLVLDEVAVVGARDKLPIVPQCSGALHDYLL